MRLDLSALENAIRQLEEALDLYGSDLASRNPQAPQLKKHLRAAIVQAFEFTYELSFKMTRRCLESISPNPAEMLHATFDSVVRQAYGEGLLLSELTVWREYRRHRGTTSHTYDEGKAQVVAECAPGFLQDARYLLAQLHERNDPVD